MSIEILCLTVQRCLGLEITCFNLMSFLIPSTFHKCYHFVLLTKNSLYETISKKDNVRKENWFCCGSSEAYRSSWSQTMRLHHNDSSTLFLHHKVLHHFLWAHSLFSIFRSATRALNRQIPASTFLAHGALSPN